MGQRSISSECIVQEALALGAHIEYLEKKVNLFYIELNGQRRLFKNVDGGLNTALGKKIAVNKRFTQLVLEQYKIPFPKSYYFKKGKEISEETRTEMEHQFPVVVKPLDRGQGCGITTNISTRETLKIAMDIAYKFSKHIIVQKHIQGDDFRVTVVGEEVVAVTQRVAPYIIGDWIHTIQERIEEENKNPLRGEKKHTKPMNKIMIDNELSQTIAREGLSLESIPNKDQRVVLKGTANISAGGEARDKTDDIHPSIKIACGNIAKYLWLRLVGIDIMTTDITKPLEETQGVCLEVNDTPGIWIHHYPAKGASRNVARKIIDLLYNV